MANRDTELMLDVGQANELKLAARRAGATNADLKALSEGDMFAKILPVLRGMAEVERVKYIVDLDANPFCPEGWTMVSHKKGGKMEFDPNKVKLHLSPNQQDGKVIKGLELQKELETMNTYNANLLDFYLANPHLIPEEWKGKMVFFWGTIYHASGGDLCVRCLIWILGRWHWSFCWLDGDWCALNPAAVAQ